MTLDELLSQPLAPVADNGFSARVIARIRAEEQRRFAGFALLSTVVAFLACLLIPMPVLSATLNMVVVGLATSFQVWVAALILGFLYLYERKFFQF